MCASYIIFTHKRSSLIAKLFNARVGGSLVVDSLLNVTPIVGFCNCSMFCYVLLYVHSSFAIILIEKRELVALLSLSSWCLVIVVRLFLAVTWFCLQFVIVVFPDHTQLLFLGPKQRALPPKFDTILLLN